MTVCLLTARGRAYRKSCNAGESEHHVVACQRNNEQESAFIKNILAREVLRKNESAFISFTTIATNKTLVISP